MPHKMNDEMDYYDSLQPTDSLSLQEMIECDMRNEGVTFDGPLPDGCGPTGDGTLDALGFGEDIGPSAADLHGMDDRLDGDLLGDSNGLTTWFHPTSTSNTTTSAPEVTTTVNGNLDFDPTALLVNPQTGLPIALSRDSPSTSSQEDDEVDSPSDCQPSSESDDRSFVLGSRSSDGDRHRLNGHLVKKGATAGTKVTVKVPGGSGRAVAASHFRKVGVRDVHKRGSFGHHQIPVVQRQDSGTKDDRKPGVRHLHRAHMILSDSTEDEDDEDDDDDDDDDDDEDFETFGQSQNASDHRIKVFKRPPGLVKANHGHAAIAACQRTPSFHGERVFPKPAYSYSCLIAMALKNSKTGSLPVSEIYSFMTENFPYFKTAPNGWKNSVRHNLSLNKCFEKIEKPGTGNQRKGCLWAMNPEKIEKMDEEVLKWNRKEPIAIKQSMAKPENFELLEKGYLKSDQDLQSQQHLQLLQQQKPRPLKSKTPSVQPKKIAKVKEEGETEPLVQDMGSLETTHYMENSLLDGSFNNGLWGELDDQMDFDIPLASDSFPNTHISYVCGSSDSSDNSSTVSSNGRLMDRVMLNGSFLSKQLRSVSTVYSSH